MTMGDELPVTSLVLPVLIRPVLTQVCVLYSICFRNVLQRNVLYLWVVFYSTKVNRNFTG